MAKNIIEERVESRIREAFTDLGEPFATAAYDLTMAAWLNKIANTMPDDVRVGDYCLEAELEEFLALAIEEIHAGLSDIRIRLRNGCIRSREELRQALEAMQKISLGETQIRGPKD